MQINFRPGSVGALMDEYEHAAVEMKNVLASMSDAEYIAIIDPNPALQSAQAMMQHVINSGYGYATYISAALGKPIARPNDGATPLAEIHSRIDIMLAFTDAVLQPHYTMTEDELDTISMIAPWKVSYTLDQMLEHAVCHIHRHRRQMEKFIAKLRG